MRLFVFLGLAAVAFAGCDRSKPAPAEPAPKFETGDPAGGVHVNDPADGVKVDVGPGGVEVKTPKTDVKVP